MGYTHYWYRTPTLDKEFQLVVSDFKKMLPILEHVGVKLANGVGEDAPIINGKEILFNGLAKCGHTERDLGITWPAPGAKGVAPLSMQHRNGNDTVAGQWFAGLQLNSRTCGGDCSHETFYLPQIFDRKFKQANDQGLLFDCTKTAYKPYDLAVNMCLIIAKHHLGDQIKVSSDGGMEDWQDAMSIVEHFLGYGKGFELK